MCGLKGKGQAMPETQKQQEQEAAALRTGTLGYFSGQIAFLARRVQRTVGGVIEDNEAGASHMKMVFPIAETSMLTPEDVLSEDGPIRAGGYRRLHEICAAPGIDRKVDVESVLWQGAEYTSIVVSLNEPYSASPDALRQPAAPHKAQPRP
jgi:hypothetical protein